MLRLTASLGYKSIKWRIAACLSELTFAKPCQYLFQMPLLQWGGGTAQVESAKANEAQNRN